MVGIQKLQGIVYELKNMRDRIELYLKNSDYVYPNVFKDWVDTFNKYVRLHNSLLDSPIQVYSVNQWDYSSTQKTIKLSSVEAFTLTLKNLIAKIEANIDDVRRKEQEKKVPFFQVRKCFKLNVEGCPVNPTLHRNKVFIGMPFADNHKDSFEYGIKPALEANGHIYFRADETISNLDIMCKVCRELQSCGLAIFNISDLNPNVMLELGLAYGVGKPVIIVKNKDTEVITDIGSIEYIEYAHAHDLMIKLQKALKDLSG
jgi:hypothetical protein